MHEDIIAFFGLTYAGIDQELIIVQHKRYDPPQLPFAAVNIAFGGKVGIGPIDRGAQDQSLTALHQIDGAGHQFFAQVQHPFNAGKLVFVCAVI